MEISRLEQLFPEKEQQIAECRKRIADIDQLIRGNKVNHGAIPGLLENRKNYIDQLRSLGEIIGPEPITAESQDEEAHQSN